LTSGHGSQPKTWRRTPRRQGTKTPDNKNASNVMDVLSLHSVGRHCFSLPSCPSLLRTFHLHMFRIISSTEDDFDCRNYTIKNDNQSTPTSPIADQIGTTSEAQWDQHRRGAVSSGKGATEVEADEMGDGGKIRRRGLTTAQASTSTRVALKYTANQRVLYSWLQEMKSYFD